MSTIIKFHAIETLLYEREYKYDGVVPTKGSLVYLPTTSEILKEFGEEGKLIKAEVSVVTFDYTNSEKTVIYVALEDIEFEK